MANAKLLHALPVIASPAEIALLINRGISLEAIANKCEGVPLSWVDIMLLEELFDLWNRRNSAYHFSIAPKTHKITIKGD